MSEIKKKSGMDKVMLGVIFALAWPTMLEQFMGTLVNYIDTAMVGSLGTEATASVGSTGTVSWLVMGMISALGVGLLAYISQAFGAGDSEKARKASAQSVFITIVLGILFTVITLSISPFVPIWMQVDPEIRPTASRYFFITYAPMIFRTAITIFGMVLRSARDTKTPMRVGIGVNIVNVVLNFLLIYPSRTLSLFGLEVPMWGAGMGVDGAAVATAISFVAGGIAITVALWRHPEASFRGQSLKPDFKILFPCIRIAVPNMLQRMGTHLGYVVFASMINALGGTSTAAHTIANTVESAFYIPGWGMQAAAATLAGNAYGAKDKEKLKSLSRAIMPLEVGLMLITGSLLFIFAEPLVRIFSKDPEVIRLATVVLRMVAVSEPFYGIPIVVEGLMQGCGRTTPPLIFNVTGMWAVRILGTFICTTFLGMGLISAWACMIGHNMFLFVIYIIMYTTGKWNPMNKKIQKEA